MLKKQNNFIQRFFSIVFFTPVIIFAIFWSAWTYFFLFFYVVILAMLEFYKLLKQANVAPMRGYGVWLGLLLYTIVFAYYLQDNFSAILGYGCIPLAIFIYIAALYSRKPSNPFLDIAATFLGILYIAIPFGMLHYLAFFKGSYSNQLILGLLAIAWSQDTGAYLVGSTIGRSKLFKRISPQKTWEGFWGGALFAVAAGYAIAYFFNILPLWQWLAISVITIFTGTYGDLVASLLKRSVDVKNASEMIPGHGGLLDRIDSLLLTIPTVVAFLKITLLFG
ncbi:MAG: phosphatidate cytidylyltransferase [Candidatus Cardinium sp.]|uniref:phosphatidate cytidylyltransferase n=1 Tax=Cardinium endosymbiont of Dermatophagoides farinae TaxID=2597823 RepID=UPI001183453E|nr:phosphatidate cytidylyltransferase [Cardinium endosymbiont of Dermatophagoides farinae]TSJ81040.1 phosphatidate cytidylyltransferase [Cardinium endosymbiont of Dermatophagoides farinae]UWW97069.1 MAG: phosphatidate cytidylyltransferase [Candidatus Cardinium sp.]